MPREGTAEPLRDGQCHGSSSPSRSTSREQYQRVIVQPRRTCQSDHLSKTPAGCVESTPYGLTPESFEVIQWLTHSLALLPGIINPYFASFAVGRVRRVASCPGCWRCVTRRELSRRDALKSRMGRCALMSCLAGRQKNDGLLPLG